MKNPIDLGSAPTHTHAATPPVPEVPGSPVEVPSQPPEVSPDRPLEVPQPDPAPQPENVPTPSAW